MATPKNKTSTKKNTPAPQRRTSPRAKPPSATSRLLDSSRAWSLAEVEAHLPEVRDERAAALKEALVGAQSNEGLAALGASFRTEDILAAVPAFVVGALLALQKLGAAPRGLALELLPLLVRETRELERVNLAFEQQLRDVSTEISGRRAQLKIANSLALRTRRSVAQTLTRHVLPRNAKQRAELERAVGKAPTAAATVASVRTVARIVAELLEDASLAPLLDSYGYDDAFVTELTMLADDTERLAHAGTGLTPPQSTDQRGLDRQDGLVVALMRAIYVPLRDVQESGAAITLPPLGAVARLVTSSPRDEDDAEPVEPASPAPVS